MYVIIIQTYYVRPTLYELKAREKYHLISKNKLNFEILLTLIIPKINQISSVKSPNYKNHSRFHQIILHVLNLAKNHWKMSYNSW